MGVDGGGLSVPFIGNLFQREASVPSCLGGFFSSVCGAGLG
jgi:hypothetical protein